MSPLSSFLRGTSASAPDATSPFAPGERETVLSALAGDEAAFEELVCLYSRRVYVIAYGITQDISEAEDMVQDTFLKVHQRRRQLRDPDKFPAWLDTVARNGARDRLRKRRPPSSPEAFATLVDSQAERPGTAMEQAERAAHLRRALQTLPEEHRTALTLLYLEGLAYRTIQEKMGLSNGALRGILGRALASLRRHGSLHPLERKTT